MVVPTAPLWGKDENLGLLLGRFVRGVVREVHRVVVRVSVKVVCTCVIIPCARAQNLDFFSQKRASNHSYNPHCNLLYKTPTPEATVDTKEVFSIFER